MHATMHALMALHDVDELTNMELKERIAKEFEERVADTFDDNNWYQLEAAVTKSGRLLQLTEEGDWRGRIRLFLEIQEMKLSPEQQWEWSWHFAWRCVCIDMNLFGASGFAFPGVVSDQDPIDMLPPDKLQEAIMQQVPRRLAEGYASLTGRSMSTAWDAKRYETMKLATRFERLWYCDEGKRPFTEEVCPYDYRAWDMTDGGEPTVIVHVDVHT